MPVTDKEYSRVKPFAADDEIVEIVFDIIKDYKIPDSDDYGTYFDTVGYWYCIALLSLSENTNILKFLDGLTDSLIARRHKDTSLLKRNFKNFKEVSTLEGMYQKIMQYFRELNDSSPVYEIMTLIGMTVPKEGPWAFSFTLTNYDKFKFEEDMSDEEKEQRFDLRVEFHSPYGDVKYTFLARTL